MSQLPRAEKLRVETLEDRTTPSAVKLPDPSTYVAGQVLFSIAQGADRNETLMALAHSPVGATAKELGFGVFKLDLKPGVTVQQAVDYLNGNGWLGFVQPDFIYRPNLTPNDPRFQAGDMWAQHNTGQNSGTADADIDAPEAWSLGRGTGQHIVAVLDDGVDWAHPDLTANMWTNAGEVAGNGIDDDGNGIIDDIHGADFVDDDGDPTPGTGDQHGTHVSGTVGAVGDNGVGVSGTALRTRIMGLRVGDSFGIPTSAQIGGFNYALANGASIINGSFGGKNPFPDPARALAIQAVTDGGIICVFAAGNSAEDNDSEPYFPTNYAATNKRVISVAATDRNDQLATFSNFGANNVTLGAPGVDIWSTVPGGYDTFDGTSMASPLVAGALAVVWDAFPNLSPDELVDLLKRSTDPLPSLDGRVATGGRINLHKMFLNATFGGYAVGADAGGGPVVAVFSPSGTERFRFFAYDHRFQGGVRVAMADVNGDRVPDIITAPGAGGGPNIRVFDGRTLQDLYSFQAYDAQFTAGLYVAARDMDGDGVAEIVTGAGEGGGPNVRVFKLGANREATLVNSFYAYAAGFSGGVRVAVGDFDNNGLVDIVTSPGFGGGPHVRVFDGVDASAGGVTVLKEFMAGDPRANVGAYVAIGNMNGDGVGDIIVGGGAGTREVRVYDGRSLAFLNGFNVLPPGQSAPRVTGTTAPTGGLLGNVGLPNQLPETSTVQVPAVATRPSAGLRVAVLDLDEDGVDDIIAAGGPGDLSLIRVRSGRSMITLGSDQSAFGSEFLGGLFVAASR